MLRPMGERPPTINRRDALGLGAGALALGLSRAEGMGLVDRPGALLALHRPGLATRDRVDGPAACAALDAALMAFTGEPSPTAALARYVFPEDRVALKVNALAAPGHPFHPALAHHLAGHIVKLGVPPDRITIYDQYPTRMRRSGYRFVDRPGQVACVHHAMRGYVERAVPHPDGKRTLRWCRVLDEATAVLDLIVPKDHDLAGITGALKNMAFGNIDRVPGFHRDIHRTIPWLYAQPEIRDKTRLIIADATRVTYDKGPQDQPKHRAVTDTILVAEDPLAMDWAVLELVNAERAKRRLPPIEETKRPPHFLARATELGLGAPLERQRWRRIDGAGRSAVWTPQHLHPAAIGGRTGANSGR